MRAARIRRGSLARETLKAWAVPWKLPAMLAGRSQLAGQPSSTACHRLSQGGAALQVEGDGDRRELPLAADREGARRLRHPGDGAQRHLAAAAAAKVERPQLPGVLLKLGLDGQDDAVLVELGEDGRDHPLAEGVVEGVVDESAAGCRTGTAVLRSMSTASRSPLSCWSLLTSRSSGRLPGHRRAWAPRRTAHSRRDPPWCTGTGCGSPGHRRSGPARAAGRGVSPSTLASSG